MKNNSASPGLFAHRKLIESERSPRIAKALILTLTLFVSGAILWAYCTEIGELAHAEGEIVPAGRLTYVEHFDGGILAEVAVRQGDRIDKGQVLARLSSPELGRAEMEFDKELSLLEDHRTILLSLLSGDDSAATPGSYAASRISLHDRQTAMLSERASGSAAALVIARDAVKVAKARLDLAETEQERLAMLFGKGLLPRNQMSFHEDLLQTVRSDLLSAQTALSRITSEEAEARAAMAEAELVYQRELRQELFDVDQNIARTEARLAELDARRKRLVVTAPTDGMIQSVAMSTPGEVVDAGERLFEILPTAVGIVAEIRVSPKDIGHVVVGNPVRLKFTAFDARRYGELFGTLERISPTSLIDPEGRPYFNGEVALESTVLNHGKVRADIAPGMVVLAEMETSRRTVLEYLLKPIDDSLGMAMTER